MLGFKHLHSNWKRIGSAFHNTACIQIKESSVLKEKLALHIKLQQLPKNSSSVRLHNRCMITGRPKGYYRDFGLSRHVLREMAHQGLLPGVQKSSW